MSDIAIIALALAVVYVCLVLGAISIAVQGVAEELRWRNARTQEEDERREALMATWENRGEEDKS